MLCEGIQRGGVSQCLELTGDKESPWSCLVPKQVEGSGIGPYQRAQGKEGGH